VNSGIESAARRAGVQKLHGLLLSFVARAESLALKRLQHWAPARWSNGPRFIHAESFGGWDGDGVAGGQQAGEECCESEERGGSTAEQLQSQVLMSRHAGRA
jgi:hypothetical protein